MEKSGTQRRSSRFFATKKSNKIQDFELQSDREIRKRNKLMSESTDAVSTNMEETCAPKSILADSNEKVKEEGVSKYTNGKKSKDSHGNKGIRKKAAIIDVDVEAIQELINNGTLVVEKENDGQFKVSQSSKSEIPASSTVVKEWTSYPPKTDFDCNMNGSKNAAHKHLLHYHNTSECGEEFELGAARSDGSHICGYKSCVSEKQQKEWFAKGKFTSQSACMMKRVSSKKKKYCSNKNASFLCFTCSTEEQPFWICDPRKEVDDDKRGTFATDYCWFMHNDNELGLKFN